MKKTILDIFFAWVLAASSKELGCPNAVDNENAIRKDAILIPINNFYYFGVFVVS